MPNTKVTFKSLADELGVDESAMKTLLNSKGLDVSDLTDAQKKAIQSQLSTGIQMNTPNLQPLTPKTTLSLNGDAPKVNLPVSNGEVDLESMSIEEIIQYEKNQDQALQKQALIKSIKAKNQQLIDLREQNLSSTLANDSAEASYQMRLESQPQLLALSIENAKTLQVERTDREIAALNGMTQAKRATPTSFEVMEVSAKKFQHQETNRKTLILNSTDELIPTMRISGNPEKQIQTVEV